MPLFETVTERTAEDGGWRDALRARQARAWEALRNVEGPSAPVGAGGRLFHADALAWLEGIPAESLAAVVTDPPYGIVEYEARDLDKLRGGRGGVWRIPPTLDGVRRRPLPRFTVLTEGERAALVRFFGAVARELHRALLPGGHVFLASNPLLSSAAFSAFQEAGFEKRGEIIRTVQTLRGGDRPKGAEAEFPEVSAMPRSCWEPWGLFRKPMAGTLAENLREYGTGGLRRVSEAEPFRDLIPCSPARGRERELAPHPSLKPQRFLRRIVRASLPLGIGIVCDPFAGSGSTLAAAEALGYASVGTERDADYFATAARVAPELALLPIGVAEAPELPRPRRHSRAFLSRATEPVL